MEYILENDQLKVTLRALGAEVVSVIDKATARELTWTADAAFWNGHGPVLFPACGGLWNGEYHWEGATRALTKHGFVRKMEWELVSPSSFKDTPNNISEERRARLTFAVRATENTKQAYPFSFRLLLTYALEGRCLTCRFRVENEEKQCLMPFQIGGHPSVLLPDYVPQAQQPIGYLQALDHTGQAVDAHCLTLVRVGEQGCWRPERYAAPSDDEGLIPICVDTFAHEALIFDRDQLGGMRVLDAHKRPLATICSEAPVFLVWQPQGLLSPFVCVEPWYGLCDEEGKSVSLIERPYSRCALPGEGREGLLYTQTF